LLDAILVDLYGPQRAITSGVLPPSCCSRIRVTCGRAGSKIPAATTVPARLRCQPDRSGGFLVNADWTQAPSAPATRWPTVVSSCTLPRPLRAIRPRPTAPFAQALRLALIEAAPRPPRTRRGRAQPGIHSETAFDQAYLASVLAFRWWKAPTWWSAMARCGCGRWHAQTRRRGVAPSRRRLRRSVGSAFGLSAGGGRAGRGAAPRRGDSGNTLGSGVLESPGLLRFLPELAEQLLGETRSCTPHRCIGAVSTPSAHTCWPTCRRC
ncbi:hypothetical protein I553_3612, partial [Mycobacterium xenopi 4042]